MTTERDEARERERGTPGGGRGRRDETGKSGIHPMSGPLPPGDAPIRPMASFGQGERGAEGYWEGGQSGVEDARAREEMRMASSGPLRRRSCRDVMTAQPAFCVAGDPVRRAAELMRATDVGAIPIVTDPVGRRLVGIVTDRDLTIRVLANGEGAAALIASVMTVEPSVCQLDDDLDCAIHLMEAQRIRRVPVVDANGRLAGMIAQADIARQGPSTEKIAEVVEQISQPGQGELSGRTIGGRLTYGS